MSLKLTTAFLTLGTPNFVGLVAFYQQLLGQEPTQLRPQIYAEFQLPGLRLGIFRPKDALAIVPVVLDESPARMSLCLEVEDLDQAIAHLSAIGYPPPGTIITASHGCEIYAYDPDGNQLILHEGKKPSE